MVNCSVYITKCFVLGSKRAVCELHRESPFPRGAEPSFGGRIGKAEGKVGQRDDAHQGDVRDGVGGGQEAAGRSRERESKT